LPTAVSDALLRREGPYAPYLQLAIACEVSDQDTINALANRCNLDAIEVNQRHIEALTWALGFSEALGESGVARH
jgi:EAL and modified HD-GYP domain-containing signal transduction protein